jgi:hypothetical protein
MNDYDQAARYAARRVDDFGFLHWALGAAVFAAWRWRGWLDTQAVPFPGEPDRRCDTVAAFERQAADAPPCAAVVEFMSEPRGNLPERLADYCLAVRRDVPYQRDPTVLFDVVGVVLNLTGAGQADAWEMAPADFGGLALRFRFKVRTLRDEDAAATLAAIDRGESARCVLAWVPLMAGADRPEVVAEWRRLAEREPRAETRADLGGLALQFAALAKRQPVWRTGLEGWNVEHSEFVREWMAIGEARGEARGLRTGLVLYLRKHYGEAAADVIALAEAQTDPGRLSRWSRAAMDAASLDEIRKAFAAA